MTDRADEVARETARKFIVTCPPPDAEWFVEEAMIPILSDIIAVALRDCAEEASAHWKREAENGAAIFFTALIITLTTMLFLLLLNYWSIFQLKSHHFLKLLPPPRNMFLRQPFKRIALMKSNTTSPTN